MTIVLAPPVEGSVKADTFVQPVNIQTSPGKGEEGCGYGVSEETLKLVVAVGGLMAPLRFPVRRYGGLTKEEQEVVVDRERAILKEAFRLSKESKRVGIELAVFGIFRFGFKFKDLAWLAEALDAKDTIVTLVTKARYATNPHYTGPRK